MEKPSIIPRLFGQCTLNISLPFTIYQLHRIDVLCLTETWLNDAVSTTEILFPGFQGPFRRDRPRTSGGGIAIYVRSGLAATLHFSLCQLTIESLCVHVSTSSKSKVFVCVVVVYRPPCTRADHFCCELDLLIDAVQRQCSNSSICVVGDFNANVTVSGMPNSPLITLANCYNSSPYRMT